MKFIPPLEIASQLMTLIQEAESELVLVSPYINIRSWDKMKKCLSKAVERGVNVTFMLEIIISRTYQT
jgi:sugar-specific transcriptional regulator TrmB